MSKDKVKKVVLAYSGGLDTSVIIRWMIENYGCEVVAFSADLGQGEDLKPLRKKAIQTGASKIIIEDLKNEFINDYVFPALKANAVYEGKYPLATALGRPLIAKKLIDIAIAEKADAVAHGCTGKGNDQVRFEVAVMTLAPDIKVIAPLREWDMKTRDDEIEYAVKHKIPIEATKKKPYSLDKNLWGTSIECGVLEDPWNAPPDDAYQGTISPEKAPNKASYVEIGFEKGVPVSLDGKKMKAVDLIKKLTDIGNANGVGRLDMVENRLVGIKSREIYEAPASTMLISAHRELEAMILDKDSQHFKEIISQKYAELIYNGLWFSPLRESLAAFVDSTQKYITGTVKIKIYKGTAVVVSRKSPYSLYSKELATYDKGDAFEHEAAVGFINLFGLQMKTLGRLKNKIK